jgi:atypical dual specificity phosphatase
MAMHGFYWLMDGLLAGCGRPGHRGRVRPAARATTPAAPGEAEAAAALLDPLDEDLAWLASQGIGAVLSLTEEPLAAGALARHGMAELHLPVDDLRAPRPAQLDAALDFIDEQRLLGRRVLVHCLVGQGRTGTILAAYLIRGGLDADEALREVRAVCPDAVGSTEQEAALREFAAQRAWVL